MLKHFFKALCVAMAIAMVAPVFAQAAPAPKAMEGVVRVKLQPQTAQKIGRKGMKAKAGKLQTGTALDASLKQIKGVSLKPVFPPSEKYAAERARFGLDQWYEIEFDKSVTPAQAVNVLKNTTGVNRATTRRPMVLFDGNAPVKTAGAPSKASTALPMNDPRLGDQWHYNNEGKRPNEVAGADINLFEAWKTETGKSDVVVAIIDGGVDYNHEDLAANMWVNEAELNGTPGVDDDGNGYVDDVYGYNFCTNSATIYPHYHGTHVAGTVAAVNNNGIGVCGVAGGDGTPGSGVKMMSCQVFDSRSGTGEGDFAKAIVYAAEMGATLAQCSWGWESPGYYEQDVLDAIKYFTAMARNDKQVGGLCIFASGNSGMTGDIYPGSMEEVLCVASMTNSLQPASYSNYGEWVDVVAPGGLLDYGEAGGVLSTLPNNSYGWMEGTSMACPHVSGIAALILSKHGNATLPATTVRSQIESGVRDFYTLNPAAKGLFGSGYVDAARALRTSDGSAPDAVATYEASALQDGIVLNWNVPNASDLNVNHHIIYYSTEEFTVDSDLTKLKTVLVDTRFLASGDPVSYELTGLQAMTDYWVAIQAVDRWGNASALSEIKHLKTNAGPKFTLTGTSTAVKINPTGVTEGSFTIGNDDEGLLRWSTYLRTTRATMSNYAVNPMISKPYNGTVGVQRAAAKAPAVAAYDSSDFMRSEFPQNMTNASELYAYIGDNDPTKPNALAQMFTVDATKYPNGFNLTHVQFNGSHGTDAVLEIYRGKGMFSEQNKVFRWTPTYFVYNYNIALPEQLWFAPGESFWVVAYITGKQYPLGLGVSNGSEAATQAYMSNDDGATWTRLGEALKGSSYASMADKATWCVKAVSLNPDWSSVLELTPSEGELKQGETATVKVGTNGMPVVNGTYTAKVHFTTNETKPTTKTVTVNLTVADYKPEINVNKVIDFGNLLVGQEKTLSVEVLNEGYGSLSPWPTITSTNENFTGPSYLDTGFPSRSITPIQLTFRPVAAGSHTGQVVVTDSKGNSVKIMVTGSATEPAHIAFEPETIEAGELVAGEDPKEFEFTITNTGKYPLEFVMPNYSDQELSTSDNAGEGVHRFGYTWADSNTGSVVYQPMTELTDGKDVASQLTDNTYWSKAVEIGFEFPYYGKNYSQLYISKFGGVAFHVKDEYVYMYGPLTGGSNGVAGTGLISAYGISNLMMGADSKVTYGHKDGNFVVNFEKVMAVVYGTEYTPISFHITLSPTGDIRFDYDDYTPYAVFNEGKGLFLALNDIDQADPLVITSIDTSIDGSEYSSTVMTGTAIEIAAPKPNIVTSVEPAYGMIVPGESTTVKATVAATADMVAGDTFTNLVVMNNDPDRSSACVRFNATIGGELKGELSVKQTELDFGKVFRTSEAKLNVTISNTGRNDLTVTSAKVAGGKFGIEFTDGTVVPARQSRDIVVVLPTETEGAVADVLTVTTDLGEATVALKGEVIGCPEMGLSYESVTETLPYGQSKAIPLTITNKGNEPLEWAVTPGNHLTYNAAIAADSKVTYTYTASVDRPESKAEWVDIVTNGLGEQTNLSVLIKKNYVTVELPFAFPFYGKEYTKMYVYGRGFVCFDEHTDDATLPEPPGDFPNGTVYTNLIAPYWGLHFPDETRTSGVYVYTKEDEAIISFMEYGNTMNAGIDYQLVMKADGSFRFVYKADNDYAQLMGIYGCAGISAPEAADGIDLSSRLVTLGESVLFNPVVTSTLAAGESATADLTLHADALGGDYTSTITVDTNQPNAAKVEIPVALTVEGKAEPVIPEKVELEMIVGSQSTDYNDFFVQQGAANTLYIDLKNTGSASYTVAGISFDFPTYEDPDYGFESPMFYLYQYIKYYDDMFGEWVETWSPVDSPDSFMPFEVGQEGAKLAMPVMPGSVVHMTPGDYTTTVTLTLMTEEGTVDKPVEVVYHITSTPVAALDRADITVEGVDDYFTSDEVITLANVGEYKLTFDLYIDQTGAGEEPDETGGGIAPLAKAKTAKQAPVAPELKETRMAAPVKPMDTDPTDNFLNVPSNFEYTKALYWPALEGSTTAYNLGSGTTYGNFAASTCFTSPEGGFNISHIYTATKMGDLENVDYTVAIVKGNHPATGEILGTGTYHLDVSPDKGTGTPYSRFFLIPLDKSVFIPEGQEFCVVINYPVGEAAQAAFIAKADKVVSNRYLAYDDTNWWYDAASVYSDQIGSFGFATTCLQTTKGAFWATLSPDSKTAGSIEPGEMEQIVVKLDASTAPLETGNKAMLVLHTTDPSMPLLNIPITLSKNCTPKVETETASFEVNEGSTNTIDLTVTEPEGDMMVVTLDDSGKLSKISAVEGAQATISDDGTLAMIEANSGAATEAKVTVTASPVYGDAGTYSLTLTASDEKGHKAQKVLDFIVNHVNRAPEAAEAQEVKIYKGGTSPLVSFADMFTDPDEGDVLTYKLDMDDANGAVEAFVSNTGVIFYGKEVGQATATVTATDSEGASTSQSFAVKVDESSGIEDVTGNGHVGIDAAPAVVTDILTVTCDFSDPSLKMTVVAMNGQVLVAETASVNAGTGYGLDLSHLPAGSYLLTVNSDKGNATFHFIKK